MVSMSYVAWLADFMRVYGTEPAQLLHGTGVDGLDLADPAAGISDSQHIVLLRNAMRLSGDPTLGLEMGYNRHISTLDRFGFAMMCCENFREALRVGFECQRVVGRFSGRLLFLSAHEESDTAVIQIEVAPELGDLTRFAIEEILGNILASTRWITGHELPLRELRCAYPAPAHAEVYRKYFACPIRFDAPDQQLRFDAGFLDTPLPQASSHAARMYRQHCRALINRDVREHDELVGRIRELTVKAGGRGMPLDECAASLSLSARTLRRKLQERGLSYQQIIDEVRSGLARTQLLAPRSSVEAVATRLGFSEAASFSRAFKRWTGMSPRQFRARGDSLR
ncbi:MAG: AraC family transcriptional regulator [Gammaproteobacteria bacterium]|jgi:AraC-like DNA-binding protein|nr:AraC family transcriptional regulator [Gammaproteobacteria bacterium]MBP6050717.1 AraC family transcriptional regulator [Pseudomonadales bacterium]MBK6584493.1 AraC family transcriptional regulator [Gammaproteobacteria bacterium]MBK7168270.1 AraC family transcriptional regulator [Gammaproteobacteria bacterium]MBK7520952.1 AraC family transcriptional regulator [Gammaproteobacteria bacterium]